MASCCVVMPGEGFVEMWEVELMSNECEGAQWESVWRGTGKG